MVLLVVLCMPLIACNSATESTETPVLADPTPEPRNSEYQLSFCCGSTVKHSVIKFDFTCDQGDTETYIQGLLLINSIDSAKAEITGFGQLRAGRWGYITSLDACGDGKELVHGWLSYPSGADQEINATIWQEKEPYDEEIHNPRIPGQ